MFARCFFLSDAGRPSKESIDSLDFGRQDGVLDAVEIPLVSEPRFNKSYYLILPVRTTIDMLICWDISWVGGGRFLLCSVQNIFMAQAEKDLLGAIDIVGIFLSNWSSSSK